MLPDNYLRVTKSERINIKLDEEKVLLAVRMFLAGHIDVPPDAHIVWFCGQENFGGCSIEWSEDAVTEDAL